MAQRLNLHSLQFKTGYARTSTDLAPAPNDYVLIFQKPGQIAVPVRSIIHANENPSGWLKTDDWVHWANGCWPDVLQMDLLDNWREARESDQERHVCPLQLELMVHAGAGAVARVQRDQPAPAPFECAPLTPLEKSGCFSKGAQENIKKRLFFPKGPKKIKK